MNEDETQEIDLKELIDMLNEMIKSFEQLPSYAMTTPITHYDHCALMILMSQIVKNIYDKIKTIDEEL